MGDLTTVYLYNTFDSDYAGTEADLEDKIALVSEVVQTYLDRDLEKQDYRVFLDGEDSKMLYLPEYPINSIQEINDQSIAVMDIEWDSSSYDYGTLAVLDGVMTYTYIASDSLTTATIDFDYKTITAIIVEMNSGFPGITSTVIGDNGKYLALKIKEVNLTLGFNTNQQQISAVYNDQPVRTSLTGTGQSFTCNKFLYEGCKNVFVWYNAGYILPEDNAGHTELAVIGDLPKAITNVANQIIQDLISSASGKGFVNNGFKSEKLADYSYTKLSGGDITNITQGLINLYSTQLSRYKRKVL